MAAFSSATGPAAAVRNARAFAGSVGGEAVHESGAEAGAQGVLAAASRQVRRVPGCGPLTATIPVAVPEHRPARIAAGPATTCRVRRVGGQRTVGIGPGHDVVTGRANGVALLGQHRFLRQTIGRAVKFGHAGGYLLAGDVDPGPASNPIAGVDGGLAVCRRRTQIGAPRVLAVADGGGQLLALRVRPRQTSQIATESTARAGHEERHRLYLLAVRRWQRQQHQHEAQVP